MALIGP